MPPVFSNACSALILMSLAFFSGAAAGVMFMTVGMAPSLMRFCTAVMISPMPLVRRSTCNDPSAFFTNAAWLPLRRAFNGVIDGPPPRSPSGTIDTPPSSSPCAPDRLLGI